MCKKLDAFLRFFPAWKSQRIKYVRPTVNFFRYFRIEKKSMEMMASWRVHSEWIIPSRIFVLTWIIRVTHHHWRMIGTEPGQTKLTSFSTAVSVRGKFKKKLKWKILYVTVLMYRMSNPKQYKCVYLRIIAFLGLNILPFFEVLNKIFIAIKFAALCAASESVFECYIVCFFFISWNCILLYIVWTK